MTRQNDSIKKMVAARAKRGDAPNDRDQRSTVANAMRRPSDELTAQINVRLTPEFRSRLNAWCALNGTTVQELVPMLLEEHLRDNPLAS